MANRLSGSSSPYLLQHADNPVDWYLWGEEALEKARLEDKPIFLSIGYAACHWCHVMAHESFEDPSTAEVMNDHFVNIKVDREERPDIDRIYMDAIVGLTGQGGWPLSVFLTPDQRPFFGGTYFPPVPRYNIPAFKDVLVSVANAWREDKDRLVQSGFQVTEFIKKNQVVRLDTPNLSEDYLDQAALTLSQTYDWESGGWGKAPKFPQPMAIEFLLRRAARGDKSSLKIAQHALHAMAKGGMYDVIGGGFARYSTDNDWLVPHFEKMLYDNAQLARAYLHAYLLTGEEAFRRICVETLDFVKRELAHPDGGFFSSIDADSEGEEGRFYLWSLDEIEQALENQSDIEFTIKALGISSKGNYEGRTIPSRVLTNDQLADMFGLEQSQVDDRTKKLKAKLLAYRGKRVPPAVDDKVLTSWNGMMLLAFSEAGRFFGVDVYEEMAIRNLDFLLNSLMSKGSLMRSWYKGAAQHSAYLEDYAALILGLLSIYQSDPNPKWFSSAVWLAEEMLQHFYGAKDEIFYDTSNDHETLLLRPRDIQDNATPSGNSLAVTALLQLSAYQGSGSMRDIAEKQLGRVQETASRYPTAFSQWLCALDFALFPVREVAILGDYHDDHTQALVTVLWSKYRPDIVAAISTSPPPEESPKLLTNRPLMNEMPTAYVCQGFVCQQPVNDVEEFIAQLDS
jgi:uncharacterized protein YyaL (SSP411 family)